MSKGKTAPDKTASEHKTPAPQTPPTKKDQPSPFSLAGHTAKSSQDKAPKTADPQTAPRTPSGTSAEAKPLPAASQGPHQSGQKTAATAAHRQESLNRSQQTKDNALAASTNAADSKASELSSSEDAANQSAAILNQQMAASNQASKTGNSQASSEISEKFSDTQEKTQDKDESWKYKHDLSDKADTKDNRLTEKFTGQQIAGQTETKLETNSAISAPTNATGTNIAERAADVLRTQTDFINLVASVASNEKTTSVQLKDGTLINLNRTDSGLDIAVSTPDSRVHRLLFDNRTSITQALRDKNIKVANLQVSMEAGGAPGRPIEGIGAE